MNDPLLKEPTTRCEQCSSVFKKTLEHPNCKVCEEIKKHNTQAEAHAQFKLGDRVAFAGRQGAIEKIFGTTKNTILVRFDNGNLHPVNPTQLKKLPKPITTINHEPANFISRIKNWWANVNGGGQAVDSKSS